LTEDEGREMGTGISEIRDVLAAVAEPLSGPCRVLDLGAQNVGLCSAADVIGFIRHFNDVWDHADLAAYAQVVAAGAAHHPKHGGINGAWLGDILSRAGFEYVAYDIFEGYRTTIFDLNADAVPAAQRDSFDLVLNCGTSEHVLNQYNVFNVMHDAVRVGGVMHHAIPMTGYLRHGYFTYTPMLFCDLARANEYEIVKMNFIGPQGWDTVSEQLVDRYPNSVRFDPSDPIAQRWHDVRIPVSLVSVTLRRTSPAPFRASLETTTAAAPVAKNILDAYQPHDDDAPDGDVAEALKAERDALDRSTQSVLDRFTDPDLTFQDILGLYDAHQKAYPGVPFSPLLEKKSLELALAVYPDRDDLRARLEIVEKLLAEQWPLYRFSAGAAGVDTEMIAMDGIEEKLLSIQGKQMRLRHAIAAFRRYVEAGHPERFPLALEFDALRYAAEELYPDDWALRLRLGSCAAQLSNSMNLRRRGE
jgi:SAM-dependent methyltransferase